MAVKIKTQKDIDILREGGRRHALIISKIVEKVAPGISTKELDDLAAKFIKEGDDKAAFLGYKPRGARRPFPASLCVSVNDAIVHGIPNENNYILKEGDIVSLDLGLLHNGLITDMAVTVPVGKIDAEAERLLRVTREALNKGIEKARLGNTTGHIGEAIQNYVAPHGFGIVKELAGHGVGYEVHEDPYVPNYGKAGEGEKLVVGMVLAIEPIINEGDKKVKIDKDGYTYRTADGKRSAHFEHTVLITETGSEVLTKI